MAEQHTYDVTIGGNVYTVQSDHELSDGQAYEYAKSQVPFDAKQAVATMRTNMAKQPGEAEMRARGEAELWTESAMGDRALSGLKGEAQGFIGGMAALPTAAWFMARHPIDSAEYAAKGIAGAGALMANAVAHPSDTYQSAKDMAARIGSDPEAIGRVAGGIDAAIATPALLRAAKNTRTGQAVSAGLSDAANKIPGVGAMRESYAASAPVPPTALSQIQPLAGEIGVQPRVVQGAEQFRTPYQHSPQPTPNAVPVKMPDGSWGYNSITTGEPLKEGTTAHVITRDGRTWSATVPPSVDPIQRAKGLVTNGMSKLDAAKEVSGGDATRFLSILSELRGR